ncbi:MAG: glycosyltransferase [Acidobacteriota bacterium]|nr:glycosyltransferase [Acidobacteriota bacterium]
MTRLRVLNMIAASGAGGAEQAFASLLQRLDRSRFEIVVACHGQGAMIGRFRRYATHVESLDLLSLRRPSTILRLVRLMRRYRVDLVHTHLWTADVLGGVAARLARIPRVVSSVHGAYFLPIGVTGVRRARRLVFSRIYRSIYRGCDRVIAVSRYVADDLATRPGVRVSQDRIRVIENGVDIDDPDRVIPTEMGSSDRWGSGSPRIAVVANFFPIKGHRFLIRAIPSVLAVFPDARFVLAGDGESRPAVTALAERLGVRQRVSFTGEIKDSLDLMRASDLVVLPSVSEGLPVTLVEAMAIGRPVVTTRAGGIPEVVEDDVSARIVPPRDPDALGRAMVELLTQPELAQTLCTQAKRVAHGRFSADRMVRRIEEVYLDLHRGIS